MLTTDQVENIVSSATAAVGSAALVSLGLTPQQAQILVSVLDAELRSRLAAVTALNIAAESATFADARPDKPT